MSKETNHIETKEAVVSQFGKNAKEYVHSAIHARGNDLVDLVHTITFNEGMLALDIATGGGHVANALAPHCQNVVALDLTPEILNVAKEFIQGNQHHNVTFIQGDAEQLPFPTEHFDLVTCRIAAHHFPQVPAFIQEVSRVLKKGGQFVLIDNIAPEKDAYEQFYNVVEKRRDYSHVRAWKKTEWIKLVEEHELEIKSLQIYEKTFKYASWCERMQLPKEEQEALSVFMLGQEEPLKKFFKVKEESGRVASFSGKSMLLFAVKEE